jgi:hypothetical protein
MLFKKQDEAARLIELQKSDQKKLDALQKKLESIRPEWLKCQVEIEKLHSQKDAISSTYRTFREDDFSGIRLPRIYEPFYNQRDADLGHQIEKLIAERDSLTYDSALQIEKLKRSLFARLAIISGAFGSFCALVANATISGGSQLQCSENERQELQEARVKAESMTDTRELLDFIAAQVERIEEWDLQTCPLFKMDAVITTALSYEPPAIRPPAGTGPIGDFETTGPGISY